MADFSSLLLTLVRGVPARDFPNGEPALLRWGEVRELSGVEQRGEETTSDKKILIIWPELEN